MPTALITSAVISKETLLNFENNLVLGRDIDWSYNEKFGKGDDQIGTTYSFRKPIVPVVTNDNMAFVAAYSAISENRVTLTIDRTMLSTASFSEADLALRVERFNERYTSKIAGGMAARFDSIIADSIVNSSVAGSPANAGLGTLDINISPFTSTNGKVANSAGYAVGSYATKITPATIMYARKVLLDRACPEGGDVYGVLTTTAQSQLVQAQASLFNPLLNIDKTYRKGILGDYAGIVMSYSQSLVAHTNGAAATLVVSAGSLANGWTESATLTVAGTSGAVKAGDVFEFAGSYIVNPLTKTVTDVPFQVQVLTAAVSGATSVVVAPTPVWGGAYQNCSATLDGLTGQLTGSTEAGVAAVGSSAINKGGVESLIWHKQAIAAAAIELTLPRKAVEMAEIIRDDDEPKFALRFIRDWDTFGASKAFGGDVGTGGSGSVNRFDAMYGIKVCNPDWVIRIRSGNG